MNYLKISIGIFLALAASRFVPHPPNFTPMLAFAVMAPLLLKDRILAMALGMSHQNLKMLVKAVLIQRHQI